MLCITRLLLNLKIYSGGILLFMSSIFCVLLGHLEIGLHIEKYIDLRKCMDYCLVLYLKYVPYGCKHWREERLKDKPRDMHSVWHKSGIQRCCPFFLKFSKQTGVSAIIFFSIDKQELLYLSHAESSNKIN